LALRTIPYRITAAAAVALTLVFALGTDDAPAAAQARVLLGDCGGTGYGGRSEPRRWDYGCTGVWDLFAAKWRRWGRPVARATGKTMLNTCDPSCAEGTVYRYRARVKVWRIRRCEDSDGNVDRYYTRLRLRYRVPAGDPFPAGLRDQTMPIACL
jgi:hypothetical protein